MNRKHLTVLKPLTTLVVVFTIAVSSSVLSAEYNWCPEGGKWVDRLECIKLETLRPEERTRGRDYPYRIVNNCNVAVYMHQCWLDDTVPGARCSDPPTPRLWNRVEPTTDREFVDYGEGRIHYWAVSCE